MDAHPDRVTHEGSPALHVLEQALPAAAQQIWPESRLRYKRAPAATPKGRNNLMKRPRTGSWRSNLRLSWPTELTVVSLCAMR